MQTVLDNELFFIEHDAARKLLFMRRKTVRLSAVDWERILDAVLSAVQLLRGQRLLLDVRLTPGDNDPNIEQKVHQFRRRLTALFPVSATVVATAVGRLQVLRMSRERGELAYNVFFDEAEAIAYLLAQDVAPPARRL